MKPVIIEVHDSKPAGTLGYVRETHAHSGWGAILRGAANALTGSHRIELGGINLHTEKLAVNVTPDSQNAAIYDGALGRIAAHRVSRQLRRSKPGLTTRLVPTG